jgi:hypothetical protein
MLIGATAANLNDYFWGIFLKYFWKKNSKKSLKVLKIFVELFC